MNRRRFSPAARVACCWSVIVFLARVGTAAPDPPPRVLDPHFELQLVAEHPDLVTPTGLAWDSHGRLLVVESHTHFRPEDYQGPAADRIRLLVDTDGDHRIDRYDTFYEGTVATMDILAGPGDWIYVATRSEIFRLRDDDQDGRADRREELVRLESPGTYPHDGLSGLVFDGRQTLYFGLGENLGEPYRLAAHDGSHVEGGGEGGNVFRCTHDGRRLERVATGFWNPFGLTFDPAGRLLAVDNDPDASPPCRLLHVVPGADFGYQFRYGRSGRHPLQAWNGELPGTLPMVAGTGEAPCAVMPWGGWLWVTSWGDNRVERYRLEPAGATVAARREVVVQGGARFRPVDLALAPDGSLYMTDWVDVSYPLHGAGRLWRLARREPAADSPAWPALSSDERRADAARRSLDWQLLDHPDPFLRQATVWNLSQRDDLAELDPLDRPTAGQRLGVLEALRWNARDQEIPEDRIRRWLVRALMDEEASLRLFAVRWAADAGLESLRPQLEAQLERSDVDARMVLAVLAALDTLDGGAPSDREERLEKLARDAGRPEGLRVAALRAMSDQAEPAALEGLAELVSEGPPAVQREAARTLALLSSPEASRQCAELAARNTLPAALRADLILGFETDASARPLLERLADEPGAVGEQAQLALHPADSPPANGMPPGPAAEETDRWLALLAGGPGDPDAGWRVFFRAQGPRCAYCHSFQGHSREALGNRTIGPDLTEIGQRLSRQRLVESILQPSRDIAPQFVPWIIEMEDGRTFSGLSLGRFDGEKYEQFVGADGQTFVLQSDQIARRDVAAVSIMPSGMEQLLTVQQFRDLLAFLTQGSHTLEP